MHTECSPLFFILALNVSHPPLVNTLTIIAWPHGDALALYWWISDSNPLCSFTSHVKQFLRFYSYRCSCNKTISAPPQLPSSQISYLTSVIGDVTSHQLPTQNNNQQEKDKKAFTNNFSSLLTNTQHNLHYITKL